MNSNVQRSGRVPPLEYGGGGGGWSYLFLLRPLIFLHIFLIDC